MKTLIAFFVSFFVGAAVYLVLDLISSREPNYEYTYSFVPVNDQMLKIINLDLCDDHELISNFQELELLLGNILSEQLINIDKARSLRGCAASTESPEWNTYRGDVLERYKGMQLDLIESIKSSPPGKTGQPESGDESR